ncbi:Thioredoxin [Gulbenkiania indica]|uniref:Thioredoxin n=2 Tax=Gulbenkiania TaxID=397456 RepID=A0A0K6GS62_9NEIS|nr:thioredoxin family protein [Gulbenkiania indica]TCW32096.1 thioredoxin [Gulbenkiania mobilis]CUA81366.1 Thioredoxin [Gulbenkiania indica]
MPWLNLDEFDFHHTLPGLPGLTLVLFGQPGCGACRLWHARLPALHPPTITHLVYVDVAESLALAREFEIFHLPALALYRNGTFHRWINAPPEAGSLAQAVQMALALPADDAP